MFYGLNNFIKDILPKRLFYRSLIIVAIPIILLQIIITIVFFDSLWIKANKGMTRSMVGEIKILSQIYKTGEKNKDLITNEYNKNFDFVISIKKNERTKNKIKKESKKDRQKEIKKERTTERRK